MRLNLYHFKVFLASTAFGTSPCQRYVVPAGPRRDTLLGQALGLVVDKATDHTHICLHPSPPRLARQKRDILHSYPSGSNPLPVFAMDILNELDPSIPYRHVHCRE